MKNPFGRGTAYRTGDLVKRLDGGRGPYLFLRRIDHQVKVDGFRKGAKLSPPGPLPYPISSPWASPSRWTASASS